MKVLLTGSKGQLGNCFQDRLPEGWQILATDSDVLDITDHFAVNIAVEEFRPDVIVNAAAYTAVDKAENDRELAERINVLGPKNLAAAAKRVGARFVHVSTDYVFDGKATAPYIETDATNPLGVYGQTKLDGEIAASSELPDTIIIRTAWVFSEYGNNFVKTMLRLVKDRDTLGIVADQRGCPTYAGDIAQAIITLIEENIEGGIYHYCGDKECSWYDFAETIFNIAFEQAKISQRPILNAINTADYPTLAKRPSYSSLNNSKIERYEVSPSNWVQALNHVIFVMK